MSLCLKIVAIYPPTPFRGDDKAVWKCENIGSCSVSSTYALIKVENGERNPLFGSVFGGNVAWDVFRIFYGFWLVMVFLLIVNE